MNLIILIILNFIFIFNSPVFAINNPANNPANNPDGYSQTTYQNLGLNNLSNNSALTQPLSASQAFILTSQIDPKEQLITLNFKIAPGYYLYQSRFAFKILDSAGHELLDLKNLKNIKNINFPEGISRTDPVFGSQLEYTGNLNLGISLKNLISQNLIQPGSYLLITYQGCSDQLCYPMQHQSVNLNQFVNASLVIGGAHEKPWLLELLGLFILGLGLAFTPCVLPMIPILSSLILGKTSSIKSGVKSNTKQDLFLACIYVLGMSLTYALLGFLITKLGVGFQAFFQRPLIIILMAVLFIFLGLATLGLFSLQLPLPLRHWVYLWDQKLIKNKNTKKGLSVFSIFLMGVLSTLVISPCTSAPLIGVLSLMATSGNSLFGAVSLFVLSLGMGLPLIIISVGMGKIIPKAGQWMQWIRILLACLMFAMAVYLIIRIIPEQDLNIFKKFDSQAQAQNKNLAEISEVSEIKVRSLSELNTELNKNLNKNQPIIILDFYANWCVECHLLADKLSNQNFLDFLSASPNKILIIRIDVTADDQNAQELLSHYQILGLPTLIILNQPDPKKSLRLVGNLSVEDLEKNLEPVLNKIKN